MLPATISPARAYVLGISVLLLTGMGACREAGSGPQPQPTFHSSGQRTFLKASGAESFLVSRNAATSRPDGPIWLLYAQGPASFQAVKGRLAKMDTAGQVLFARALPANQPTGLGLAVTADDYCWLLGSGSNGRVLTRLTPDGSVQWSKGVTVNAGPGNSEFFSNVLALADGSALVQGQASTNTQCVMRVDPSGIIAWVRQYELPRVGTGIRSVRVPVVAPVGGGGMVVMILRDANSYYLWNVDEAGQTRWLRQLDVNLPPTSLPESYAISPRADGSVVATVAAFNAMQMITVSAAGSVVGGVQYTTLEGMLITKPAFSPAGDVAWTILPTSNKAWYYFRHDAQNGTLTTRTLEAYAGGGIATNLGVVSASNTFSYVGPSHVSTATPGGRFYQLDKRGQTACQLTTGIIPTRSTFTPQLTTLAVPAGTAISAAWSPASSTFAPEVLASSVGCP